MRGLLLTAALLIAGGMLAGCGWLDFAMSGPKFFTAHTTISASDTQPRVGEEIEVWATHGRQPTEVQPADERETQFFLIEPSLPWYSFTASGGQFRAADGELNKPSAVYEGAQIEGFVGHVYWRAPAEPGKYIIGVKTDLDAADLSIWVQPAASD